MENKSFDIVSFGEILIDMTPAGKSPSGHQLYEANAGGAPGNALAMSNKLGSKCAFIGKVGNDTFGAYLIDSLTSVGIDASNVLMDDSIPTTLAMVTLDKNNDRSFTFYRKPGADMMLSFDEVDKSVITSSRVFHYGTISLNGEPCRTTTEKLIDLAKDSGCILTFDPNVRLHIWDNDKARVKDAMRYGLSKCDVLKISDDELEFYTGISDLEKAAENLKAEFSNIRLMFVTLGPDGCRVLYENERIYVPAFKPEHVADTTGAGDAFTGTCIDYIAKNGFDKLNKDVLTELALRANAAASIVITRLGALLSMPAPAEIDAVLEKNS